MVMASACLVWQVPAMDFFARVSGAAQPVLTGLSLAGVLVWAAWLLYLLVRWRPLLLRGDARVTAALEDELVRANRAKSFSIGYFVALAVAALMFALSLFLPVTGTDAAHVVLVVTVVAPIYAFVVLERINA